MRSSPSVPAPPPPAPPEPPPVRTDPIVVQNEQRDVARRKRGRASTILTGGLGDTSPAPTAAATLLGK
jgi:hypothetical protein